MVKATHFLLPKSYLRSELDFVFLYAYLLPFFPVLIGLKVWSV